MSIRNWLSRLLDRQKPQGPASVPGKLDEDTPPIDLRNAIEAHQAWKTRLEEAIRTRSELTMDARKVRRDDICPLGQWIHGAGSRQFGADAQFLHLRSRHASFHQCAARSVLLAQSGEPELALREIRGNSEFASVSWEVIGDLASMFTRLDGARG